MVTKLRQIFVGIFLLLLLFVPCGGGVSAQEGSTVEPFDDPALPGWERSDNTFIEDGVLQEIWTGVMPSSAYWNPVRVHSDTRLKPFEVDENEYVFSMPEGSGVQVDVKLIYRRAYKELMDQKGWDFPDIVMKAESLRLP